MESIEQALHKISAGRVLDVATGKGDFALELAGELGSFTEIVGIDNSERAIEAAHQAAQRSDIHFEQMNAGRLDFPDSSFDTVAISNSVHHLDRPDKVLEEMKRVLKPGGHFILSEMYRDGQTETQMTHVKLHHWWAAIDTARGVSHYPTYTRQELIDTLVALDLAALVLYDYSEPDRDPKDPKLIEEVGGLIDLYQQRAVGLPGEASFIERGEILRRRLHDTGLHWATLLFALGKK